MSLLYDARLVENSGIGTTIRGQLREILSRKIPITLTGNSRQLASHSLTGVPVIPFDAKLYSIKEQTSFPRASHARIHVPHYNAPLRYLSHCSVTVHDLIHLQSDEFKHPAYRAYASLMLSQIARRSPCILTVSETTRSQFLSRYPEARHRTFTTLNGIDHKLFRPASSGAVAALKKKHSLPDEYFLAIGIGKKHKNIDFALRALKHLWKDTDCPPIVLAGAGGKIPSYATHAMMENSVRKNVILLPHVPESDLPAVYSSALALIMPSLLEGFGLPALEAMACGTPVLASTGGSLPEVIGHAARFFDPRDEDAFIHAVQVVLQDSKQRARLRSLGLSQAAGFTWKRNVDAMMRAYHHTGFEDS